MLFHNKTPVKFIRCDNAGENKTLQLKCQNDTELASITFEFTARDSPQYNGKVERKIAVLHSRVRSMLTAAGIPQPLRSKLWAEAGSHATDVENTLVSLHYKRSPYQAIKITPPHVQNFRQFGTAAIINFSSAIKGKLTNRGTPVIYLGRAADHAKDTFRFLNLKTNRVVISRDAIWLNQTYGEYTGNHRLHDYVTITPDHTARPARATAATTAAPVATADPEAGSLPAEPNQPNQPPLPVEATSPRRHTRSQGPAQLPTPPDSASREARTLVTNAATTFATVAATANDPPLVERLRSQSGRETANSAYSIFDVAVMIDRFGADYGEMLDDFAMVVEEDPVMLNFTNEFKKLAVSSGPETEDYETMLKEFESLTLQPPKGVDPSRYKDMFTNP
jgi:hypothetical protein